MVTDDMDIGYFADPSAPSFLTANWDPIWYFDNTGYNPITWNATIIPHADFVFGGMYLDNDVLYLIDSRNRLLRAMQVSDSGITELLGSPYYWPKPGAQNGYPFVFSEVVSMVMVSDSLGGTNQLWLPLRGSMEGVAGIAIVVPTNYFGTAGNQALVPFFVPLPAGCAFPQDFGSVAITPSRSTGNKAAVLLLNAKECGAVMLTADAVGQTSEMLWQSLPGTYSFDLDGEHPHPAYDTAGSLMLYIDFGARFGIPQQLCCTRTTDYNRWVGVARNLS